MKRVERTALPKATSHDLKDLCEGAPFKCPKCLKMISLKWWSLYNSNNIWSFHHAQRACSQIISLALGCRSSMIYYAVKIHQLSPAQHITETQEEIILLWCEPTSYCTITEAQSYRWCSGGKMACFSQYGYSVIDSKAIITCHVKMQPLHFPCLQLCVHVPSLRRTNCAAPSESDPVWLNACKHFLSLHTIQRVHINPKRRLVKTV